MKISSDDSSWRAGGIRHRDNRHDHGTSEVPRHRGKKKDTKKWCKGKVGREHQISTVEKWDWCLVDKCMVCGKELNFRRNPDKPMWPFER